MTRADTDTDIVIVGAAETDEIGKLPGHSTLQLHIEAALNAMSDCGIGKDAIDGVATLGPPAGPGPVAIAHYLGITPAWLDSTTLGGTSFLMHVRHAVGAIRAGLCSTVLITHGESGRSRVGQAPRAADPSSTEGQFEAPYGAAGPPTRFTIPLLRYMKETGLTHEQLAGVAVAQRRWAQQNPRAMMRDPITVDDVLASRMIAYPFHLLECCLVTDGGGALVVTTADRAADLDARHPLVHVLGTGEAMDAPVISMMEDFTTFKGFRLASRAAFTEASVTPADVDHLMVYDAFAHLPIYALEDMGFVERGAAGSFIEDGNTSPGGRLPMNTNGGGLSYTHTGNYGMFAILESVRQLRGQAAAQVPDPLISVVQGNGGTFMSAATLVLSNGLA